MHMKRFFKRFVLVGLVALAGFAIFAGPYFRGAFALPALTFGDSGEISVPKADLDPVKRAMNFLLDAPAPEHVGPKQKLWATYYHMPTVRPAKAAAGSVPLLGRNGKPISPPLSKADWCDAAMQGSIWIDTPGAGPGAERTAYMYVDANGPEQINCDAHFGVLSDGIKSATRRARFVAFHHPRGCDVRPIPLMAFRTIAVDPKRFKMGTVLYVPALRGLGFWMEGELYAHDGYVVASDRGGAIAGNHVDMFVDNANAAPFPDVVASRASRTFEAYVVDKADPAAVALKATHEEICKDSDRPGRKRKKTGTLTAQAT
jgi:3D (Asp-Asp-Asp) domain-containing protein